MLEKTCKKTLQRPRGLTIVTQRQELGFPSPTQSARTIGAYFFSSSDHFQSAHANASIVDVFKHLPLQFYEERLDVLIGLEAHSNNRGHEIRQLSIGRGPGR